jgi:tryptophanase
MTKKCQHHWKRYAPKITYFYDGYDNIVTLVHTDWCKKCYLIKERSKTYREILVDEYEVF